MSPLTKEQILATDEPRSVHFIEMYNSWGDQIGLQGFQFFGEDYINSGYITDCIAFSPTIKGQKISIIQQLISAMQKLLALLQS